MTRLIVRCSSGLPLLLVLGCARGDADRAALGPIETLASPAAPGSGEPNLAAGRGGHVYLGGDVSTE